MSAGLIGPSNIMSAGLIGPSNIMSAGPIGPVIIPALRKAVWRILLVNGLYQSIW